MSKLRSVGHSGKYAPLIQQIQTLTTSATGRYNAKTASVIASLESADQDSLQAAQNSFKAFQTDMSTAIQTNADLKGLGLESLVGDKLTVGMEAAAIIMAASQDPDTYYKALRAQQAAPAGLTVRDHGEAVASLEAFDNREISNKVELSIAYQLVAARQDEAGEALFHTLVLTPDQAMYRATIERTFVTTGAKHRVDGGALELKKTNVLEAFRDPTVLRNDSTKIIPVVTAENVSKFIPTNVIAHQPIVADGYDITTAPIAITANNFSLVALSTHAGLVEGGMFNQNDAVDHSVRLDNIYLQVTNGTVTERFKIRVRNNPTAQFLKTTEQGGKLVRLNFRSDGIRVSGLTKTVAGAASTLLAPLTALEGHLNLRVNMNMDLALDRATVSAVSALPVEKLLIETADGQKLLGATHSATDDLTFSVICYDLDARRTNSALRTRGLLADSDIYQEVYTIGLLPPFTVQRPRNEQGSKDVDTLVTLTHVAISNGAITKLFDYRDTVRDYFVDDVGNTSTADWITGGDIEGIARMLITPYYEHIDVNLPEVLNSITSSDKLSDVRNHFVNVLTEASYRMIQRTGYRPAMEMLSGAAGRKVQITAATDVVLPQYLMIEGDDRTVGPVINLKVVSSADVRMLGKIFAVFTTESKEFDPLHFGNLLWIPELVSKTDVSREGQHLTETTVHPRYRHINNVPAMIEITVAGLTEVIQKRTSLNVNSTLMNPEDLPQPGAPVTP